MQFLTIRELTKAPKSALTKLAQDGKAVLTNNGKPAAIMLNVNMENFERMFHLVQELEKYNPAISDKARSEAFDRLLKYKRKKAPPSFDYRRELMESMDERFSSIN